MENKKRTLLYFFKLNLHNNFDQNILELYNIIYCVQFLKKVLEFEGRLKTRQE